MRVETDLKRIAKMAKKKDDENWAFRSYLKVHDIENDELDKIVHRLNEEISAQIDCTQCGNCCREIRPVLDNQDISRFAISLDMSPKKFREAHVCEDDDGSGDLVFTELPCQFLDGKECSNYAYRPKDCHSYPHLHKPDFRARIWGVINNYEICPIVYNVYERLKVELWPKKRRSARL